jgi:putative pyruvate formate lyase activating enzyme
MTEPRYLDLYRSGELLRRAEAAQGMLEHCELCPHRCGVNRLAGERGVCRMGDLPKVSSWNLHRWEEPPISGTRGSGTIFFSGCTGRCSFCQNYPISQLGYGKVVDVQRLASMMLELQRKGAHNINFVTPTHFVPQILAALLSAVRGGLRLPLVYNTSGYERETTLRLLDGIIDIWLPDAKYGDDAPVRRLSGFKNYVASNRAALREMYRQVGHELTLDPDGLAVRGLIIRHMILPEGLAGTAQVLCWIAKELSPRVHVSLMDQFFPAYRAIHDPILGRKTTPTEYLAALEAFDAAGLERGWFQNASEECSPQIDA